MWQQCKQFTQGNERTFLYKRSINSVSDIVVLNENEFICVFTVDGNYSILSKYNVNNDEWDEMLIINDESQEPSLCLNTNTNVLYHYVHNNLSLCDLSVEHKKFVRYRTTINVYNQSCLITNNDLHLVGGYTNRNHLIYDSVKKKFISQYTFDEWKRCIEGAVFVHIPSRNMVLLLGGYDAG
eukprot:195054_1